MSYTYIYGALRQVSKQASIVWIVNPVDNWYIITYTSVGNCNWNKYWDEYSTSYHVHYVLKKNWLWSSSANTWISIAVSLSAAAQSPIYSAVKAASFLLSIMEIGKAILSSQNLLFVQHIHMFHYTLFAFSKVHLLFSIEKSLQLIILVLLKRSLNIEKYLLEEIKTGNGNRS